MKESQNGKEWLSGADQMKSLHKQIAYLVASTSSALRDRATLEAEEKRPVITTTHEWQNQIWRDLKQTKTRCWI